MNLGWMHYYWGGGWMHYCRAFSSGKCLEFEVMNAISCILSNTSIFIKFVDLTLCYTSWNPCVISGWRYRRHCKIKSNFNFEFYTHNVATNINKIREYATKVLSRNVFGMLVVLSSLYVCMAIKHIIILYVETPRKFITAKLSIRKPGSSSVLIIWISNY
jgi:hypothetical protein